jgi:hypothetical protein
MGAGRARRKKKGGLSRAKSTLFLAAVWLNRAEIRSDHRAPRGGRGESPESRPFYEPNKTEGVWL